MKIFHTSEIHMFGWFSILVQDHSHRIGSDFRSDVEGKNVIGKVIRYGNVVEVVPDTAIKEFLILAKSLNVFCLLVPILSEGLLSAIKHDTFVLPCVGYNRR